MPNIRDLLERNAVSILSRLGANRHLDDDALLEIWAAATSTTDPHLTSCAHCRARFASIDTWLAAANTKYVATIEQAQRARFDRADAETREQERIQQLNDRFKDL